MAALRFFRASSVTFILCCVVLSTASVLVWLSSRGSVLVHAMHVSAAAPRCVSSRFVQSVISAVTLGLGYGCWYLHHELFLLSFSSVHQGRWHQLRSRLGWICRTALWLGSGLAGLACLAHGVLLRVLMAASASASASAAPASPDAPVSVLTLPWVQLCLAVPSRASWTDTPALAELGMASVIVLVCWEVARALTQIIGTEPVAFTELADGSESAMLVEALTLTGDPLLRTLAFRDLVRVAMFDSYRRSRLYTEDSGAIWSSLVARCCLTLDGLAAQLAKATADEQRRQRRAAAQAFPLGTMLYYYVQRNYNPFYRAELSTARVPDEDTTRRLVPIVYRFLRDLPGFSRVFLISPDHFNRQLFSELRVQMWAAEALAVLLAHAPDASDQVGHVRRSLSAVLCSLVACLMEVESHFAQPSTLNPPLRDRLEGHQLVRPQVYALVATLRSSIYTIMLSSRSQLASLAFPEQYAAILQAFADMRM